ncbi:dipeptide ABC transporter permease DppC, partial [Salmonella enterica]
LVAMALIAVFAGLIAPYAPLQQTADSLAEPSAQYLFGTDNIGRDIFSLVVHGARSSLLVGLGAALAALLVGGTVGILAGYFQGPVEA